jgi:hypothetical protein
MGQWSATELEASFESHQAVVRRCVEEAGWSHFAARFS